MTRREFPADVRTAAYERCGGFCEGCGDPLVSGGYQFDHSLAAGLGGPATLENCEVLCSIGLDSCHSKKTRTHDVPRMAKADRAGKKHRGEKTKKWRRPIPGSRDTRWKRKLDGTVEPR